MNAHCLVTIAAESSLPFNVAITGAGVEVGARLMTATDVDKLVQILETIKPLLGTIYGSLKAIVIEPEASDRA